jgi:hypothetical protein
MEWGTPTPVQTEHDANAHVAAIRARLPEVKSAYVPSGKMPPIALFWLALGSGLGVPAGALTGLVLGGITVVLLVLIGFLLGAMASVCGRVLCIVVLAEIAVALIGAVLTFGGIGAVPAWITAWAGKFGKNRNAWAATVFALPSAVIAYAVVAAVPQVAAYAVGPADPSDDFALSSLVHLLSDFSWTTLALWGLGFLVTVALAAFYAHDTVGLQKFCEPCERYMDEAPLHGLSLERGVWAIDAIRAGNGRDAAPHLAAETGRDLEPHAFGCSGCGRGYFEARAHAHATWNDANGKASTRTANWLCASIETAPDATRALMAAKKNEDAS